MKYIPLESFEAINSLLQAVEALGCLVTLRLEAFTCRLTREEKQIASNLAQYIAGVQSTPPITPSPVMVSPGGGRVSTFEGGAELLLPPPLVLGAPEVELAAGPVADQSPGNSLVTADDIDDRLVYMVAALNGMYEKDGYDFSVLTERDFLSYTPAQLREEVDTVLRQLPEACAPAVAQFWTAVGEQVSSEGDCEAFEFSSPACDPRAETSIFSRHLFLYSRSRKILITIVMYGDGNRYCGDDGVAVDGEDEDGEGYREKNIDFYGCQ